MGWRMCNPVWERWVKGTDGIHPSIIQEPQRGLTSLCVHSMCVSYVYVYEKDVLWYMSRQPLKPGCSLGSSLSGPEPKEAAIGYTGGAHRQSVLAS